MPVATECPHCGKAYQVAEASVGKQVKCQSCGKAFAVRASSSVGRSSNANRTNANRTNANLSAGQANLAAGQANLSAGQANLSAGQATASQGQRSGNPAAGSIATASGTAVAAGSTALAERTRVVKLEAELGLQPLPPNPNKVFPETPFQRPKNSPSPLSNHVIDDPGFEQLSEAELTAQRRAEAAAREAAALTYGKDEDELAPSPARENSKAEQFGLGVAGVVLFYVIGNVIVYFATDGESLLMPRAMARLLNLAQ